MNICFFAHTPTPDMLDRVEFYRQDIEILRSVASKLTIATRWSELGVAADLYFVWWWTWAFMPMIKAKLHHKPIIITGSFDHPLPGGGWEFDRRPNLHRALIRWALRCADANVFVSKLEHERIPRLHRVNRPIYIPHIVDETVYYPADCTKEDFVMTIAWMENGNSSRKCIPEIIRAAKIVIDQCPHIRFVIAGERGSDYPRLAQLAKSLGVFDAIDFPGAVTRAQKIRMLQRCKVYVQPTHYEGFGLAILEAMSCGAAVVTSNGGAVSEVVGDSAVIVDANSPEEIAKSILKVLQDQKYLTHLGRSGSTRARTTFPFDRRREDLKALISSLVDARSLGPKLC